MRSGRAVEGTSADRLRKDGRDVAVQALEREAVDGRGHVDDALGVAGGVDGVGHGDGIVGEDGERVLAFGFERTDAGGLEGFGARHDLALHVGLPFADHDGAHVGGEKNVGFADGAFGRDERRHVLVEHVAVELGHADLGAGLAGEQRVEAHDHGESGEVDGHHLAHARGVRAKRVVVEGAGGLDHFGRELAVGGEELVVLVEAHAHREAVDGLALGGGGHDELVALFEELDGFGRNGDVGFARGDLPGVVKGEAAAVERDRGGTGCAGGGQGCAKSGHLEEILHGLDVLILGETNAGSNAVQKRLEREIGKRGWKEKGKERRCGDGRHRLPWEAAQGLLHRLEREGVAVVAEHAAFLMFGVAGRAGHVFAVVVRGVRVGLVRIGGLRLFGEVLPGAVAGEAGLVVGNNEGVAGDGVFRRVAGGAVGEGLVMVLELAGGGLGAGRKSQAEGGKRKRADKGVGVEHVLGSLWFGSFDGGGSNGGRLGGDGAVGCDAAEDEAVGNGASAETARAVRAARDFAGRRRGRRWDCRERQPPGRAC